MILHTGARLEEPIMGRTEAAARRSAGTPPQGAVLRVSQGFFEGLDIPIDRERMVIGRGQGADIVIAEATMSRCHAALGYADGDCFVEDLGSTNGTFVNGTPQRRARLHDGDEIRFGRLRLAVRLCS